MLDRKRSPQFRSDFSYPLISPRVVHTSSGVSIHIVSAGQQDVVRLEVVLNAGKWFEPAPVISQLTASMLNKGTGQRSSFEISQIFDQLGVHFDATAGYDFTTLTLYGLPSNVVRVLPLFAELVISPSFPSSELEILKTQFTQSLKINLEKNSYIAGCLSRETIFGADHPYGKDLTANHINQADTSMLSAFHQERYGVNSIILSGKISHETEHQVIKAFDAFRPDINVEKMVPSNDSVKDVHVEKSDSVQTSIRIGKKSIGRTHKEYAAILLLNHALGGYFGSRLMTNIREQKGLTYGIYSSINALKHGSYFTVGTDVKKEKKELAIDEIKSEIETLRGNLIPAEEFNIVRNHFVGSLQTELSTPFAHAEKAKTTLLHNLDPNFYKELLVQIGDLTPEDLRNCANTHLDTSSMAVVTVG